MHPVNKPKSHVGDSRDTISHPAYIALTSQNVFTQTAKLSEIKPCIKSEAN